MFLWWACSVCPALALNTSQNTSGSNLGLTHSIGIGAGVRVGILDGFPFGISPPPLSNIDPGRVVTQVNFSNLQAGDVPATIAVGDDFHETLVADVLGGAHPIYRGTAPGVDFYLAGLNNAASFRAATRWMLDTAQARVWNLSIGLGHNLNGNSAEELLVDWAATRGDALLVFAAGNFGSPISNPAGAYNGLTVGAFDEATQGRATISSFQLAQCADCRAKPDLLAPGVRISDGIAFGLDGTSFAAPHVAGTSAVLLEIADGSIGPSEPSSLFARAAIMNSARKRGVGGPGLGLTASFDLNANATVDSNYLNASLDGYATAPSLTTAWTPTAWTNAGGGFSTTAPLDEEQGAGLLDTQRAVVQTVAGRQGPGSVSAIGWDLGQTGAAPVAYSLASSAGPGAMLTATLVWDREVMESDGDGVIEATDTYTPTPLQNLLLRVRDGAGGLIAESASTLDNLQHLHIPLAAAAGGVYSIEVLGPPSMTQVRYGLAWWLSDAGMLPGDFNRDGLVDPADLAVWGSGFQQAPISRAGLRPGDANGDLAIDAADYTLWRDNLGRSLLGGQPASAPASASIPEPAAFVLAGCLALVGLARFGSARSHQIVDSGYWLPHLECID